MTTNIQILSLNTFRKGLIPDTKPNLLYEKPADLVLTEQESLALRNMIDSAQLHATFVDENFDSRFGCLQPPRGYVAVVDKLTMFDQTIYDRNLFRGVAMVEIKREVNKYSYKNLAHLVNAVIPDRSPIPATRTNPETWVCSLGANGWLGIYESPHATDKRKFALVVSGLDEQCYENLAAEMKRMHGQTTVENALTQMEFWRNIAKQNRTRLLATLLYYLGDKVNEESVEFSTRGESDLEKLEQAREWFGDKTPVPIWFHVPDKQPNKCKPIPDNLFGYALGTTSPLVIRHPVSVRPMFDIVLDDISHQTDMYMYRLSGFTNLSSQFFVLLRGPADKIVLVERTSSSLRLSEAHNSVCTESKSVFCSEMQNTEEYLEIFWEEGEKNRMLMHHYPEIRCHPVLESEKKTELIPVFVRVSMQDALGNVGVEFDPSNRFLGFHIDDHKFIQR